MTNAALAGHVAELADLMALDGAGPHRIRHYRRTATAIRRFEHPLSELIGAGADLTMVPGIGKGLAGVLQDLVLRGSSPRLQGYRTRIPEGLLEVMRLGGVGATRARVLRGAGIDSVAALEDAIASRRIYGVDGFGTGVVRRVRGSLAARAHLAGKVLLPEADRVAAELVAHLRSAGIESCLAGDVRRRTEVVQTVDAVCGAAAGALWDAVRGIGDARVGGSRGDNPVLAGLEGVDARLVAAPPDRVEAIAHHLTGPPPYIEALVARAHARELELTPMGIAGRRGPATGGKRPATGGGQPATGGERPATSGKRPATGRGQPATSGEAEIYERLGLPLIPPELREDAGTIERAESGIPQLVKRGDIRGDLHMHTTWSDGAATLRRMVDAAAERGYAYVAITDHSPSTRVVAGLDAARLRAQSAEIERVQEARLQEARLQEARDQEAPPAIRVLRGCEVDILPDGSLDLDDETLAELDLVVASVHSSLDMSRAQMTRRIVSAIENPFVDVLGHPTGRKLGRRLPCALDLEAVLRTAAALDVAVEVNAGPRRLDLDHTGLRLCGELGVTVAVSSDAHSVAQLDNIRYGVDQARRGWLQADQIVNTRTCGQLLEWLGRRRA